MHWRKLGLFMAAGAVLLMSGCDASASLNAVPAGTDSTAVSAGPESTPDEAVETAVAAGEYDAASTLTPASEDSTIAVRGTIMEMDPEQQLVTIAPGESTDPSTWVAALITDKTLIIDNAAGTQQLPSELAVGQQAAADVSPRMTRSIPPQAEAYAIFVGEPDSSYGTGSYVRALDVMTSEDGSTVVLNQNADLYVTIPATLTIGRLGSAETVPASDIQVGSVLLVWYDWVAESYPAQTTATRVLLAG